jgi:N-acetylglucosamine-6-phosphate deacetylase
MTTLVNARVVTPHEVLDPGWIRIGDGRIEAVGAGDPPRTQGPTTQGPTHDLERGYVLPGFVDLHMHGGGGAQVTTGDPDEILRAIAFHRRHGTTRTLASLVTSPVDRMATAADAVVQVMRSGDALGQSIAGIHLEGPFLNPRYRGAHHTDFVLPPDVKALRRLLDAGAGEVRVVTLAPELDGASDLIRELVAAAAIASVGHTDATYEQARHAFDEGARTATGMRDGQFGLGPLQILAREGKVTLLDGVTNAGSTLTTDRAVRHAVNCVGVPILDAAKAAATTPARVLGLPDQTGSIVTGKDADLVVLSDTLHVRAVIARGHLVHGDYDDPTGVPAGPKPGNT